MITQRKRLRETNRTHISTLYIDDYLNNSGLILSLKAE